VKPGVIALLGSGETAPSMTKVHRQLFNMLGEVRAVALDTSYAFQTNVPQMTAKIVDYFAVSLRTEVVPVHLGHVATTPVIEQARARQAVRHATYVFAGPGSPSYALRQWSGASIGEELANVVRAGGVVSFASAAALTLGAFTAPIYEIYKAGADPHWLEGLDVLALSGLKCAVIPHFDNSEGGNYDTRYCYLGEERLEYLEGLLPADAGILGIDEHTALIIDLAADEVRVMGRANAHWRKNGVTITLQNGTATPLDVLQSFTPAIVAAASTDTPANVNELNELVQRALDGGTGAADAIATLADRTTAACSQPSINTSLIDQILQLRTEARSRKDFGLSDRIREILNAHEIEVIDDPTNSRWNYKSR